MALSQIYIDALEASMNGKPQYVLSKSLDLFRTGNKKSALKHLQDGYCLKAKCVSGVLEASWKLEKKSDNNIDFRTARAMQEVSRLAGLRKTYDCLIISTQEFFTPLWEKEAVHMTITALNNGDAKPEFYWVTPKDKIAEPKLFAKGQEKVEKILDALQHLGIHEDSDFERRILEAKYSTD